MSTYHAYADDSHADNGHAAIDLVTLVWNGLIATVALLRNAVARRATEERVAGFPEHLLRDLGYERDWDGSIHPARSDDA